MYRELEGISREQFEAFRDVRRGQANPERMDNPFWHAMVRWRAWAFGAREHFEIDESLRAPRPIWCFSRVGMSKTILHDNSIVFIGGEHEDFYDPDFMVYNDVIIRRWDGSIEIYGYPFSDFSPTDFHTATQVNRSIYVIGAVGYPHDRIVGTTSVYELDLESMSIRRIEVQGEEPGWISRHEAIYWVAEDSILIWGGQIFTGEDFESNMQMWAFSLRTRLWRKVNSVHLLARTGHII